MAKVEGLEKLSAELQRRAARYGSENASVIVGYTAAYAIYVHENMEALHGAAFNAAYIEKYLNKQGKERVRWNQNAIEKGYGSSKAKTRGENQQAKFLETPYRQNQDQMKGIVFEALRQGKTLAQALLLAGMFLQRESQKIVPVDTGNLRASAFTRLEVGMGLNTPQTTEIPTEGAALA